MDIHAYWRAVLRQDAAAIRPYFAENAYVNWHCTNEHFTAEEFIRANCEYPDEWDGTIERVERADDLLTTVTRVFRTDGALSFHVVSFFKLKEDRIVAIDEIWGEDGSAPQWRADKRIGTTIF